MVVKSLPIPKQVCYEDVKEFDEIPSVTFNLTIQRMVMSAAANRDFAPLHHNIAAGQRAGAPSMFLNNVSCLAMWERVVTDWIGIYGRVKKAAFRITTFNAAGDAVLAKGKVTKKWQEEGLNLVELEMTCEHARGTSMAGTVVVALPSRAHPRTTPRW